MSKARLAILTSHPIQYYAPLFRTLAERVDLHVFFAHRVTSAQNAETGFGQPFEWDLDLTAGYPHTFLRNVAKTPSSARFAGCDTPEIGARLAEGGFSHVLSIGWHLMSLLQGMWAAKRQGLALMVRGDSQLGTRRSSLKRVIKAATYPHFLRQFDAVLYVGAKNRSYYAHYGVPDQRLFYSPHAIDTARFTMEGTGNARADLRASIHVGKGDKLVLFAGKLIEIKRSLDVLDMVAELRRTGVGAALLVAGSGPLEDALRHRAEAYQVPAYFLGFQNQTRMPAVYAAADALVLPSASETWGLVVNEALAVGTPILVSDAVGCAPDLAADGSVGRTFPLGNIAVGAAALRQMLLTPPPAEAIRLVSERHSLSAAADGILAAIADVPRQRMLRSSAKRRIPSVA